MDMIYSVSLSKLAAGQIEENGRRKTEEKKIDALKTARSMARSPSDSETREKKMASDRRSGPIVAPGIDILFEFMDTWGLPLLILSVLVLLVFVMWNVTTFIPGSAWSVPAAVPPAK